VSRDAIAFGVEAFVALLAAAVLISILAERVRIPAAVALVAAGSAAGTAVGLRPPFDFGPTLLFVFLPPLIFEAAWNIDLRALRGVLWRVILLAFPGTLVTASVIAFAVHGIGALPLAGALLLGAMVCATDPVAVVAVFRRVPVPVQLRTLVEAESLANDGVSVVLYGIALTIATGAQVSVADTVLRGIVAMLGGALIGALLAIVVRFILPATKIAEYEVTATLALAYGAYLAADAVHCSGIFATASGAIYLRALLRRSGEALSHGDDVDRFWNAAAFVANALVFIATGLLIDPRRLLHEPVLIVTALALVIAARVLLALIAVRSRAARLTVFLAGMRGALPLALALSLPRNVPNRPQIIDAVFATVLVTLVVLGIPLEAVVRALFGTPASEQRAPAASETAGPT
jgi:CPA1 family monovalent cation:H+ antiporter